MGKNSQKFKRAMGGHGSHKDVLFIVVVIFVALYIIFQVYPEGLRMIADGLDTIKNTVLALFGL